MQRAEANEIGEPEIHRFLAGVRALMAGCLGSTPIGRMVRSTDGLLAAGKMLRSRMAFHLGHAAGVPLETMTHASAAVELIHAASLLHDDVIDGGLVRRSAPTFWVKNGIPGAILLGDLLLFKAVDLTCQVEGGRLTHKLVRLTGEVCEAESEQELILRGCDSTWANCVSIARRKTGALFAFIGYACAGQETPLQAVLEEAGYAVGTAYQISDDILDLHGDECDSGKTLGTDAARRKTTAANLASSEGMDPLAYVCDMCRKAETSLVPWPHVLKGWEAFMDQDMQPALEKHFQYPLEA